MKYANLHLHSTYSDAQYTPQQLLLIGKSLGYRALALTDHDTDGGYQDLYWAAKREGGIDVTIGAEFYGKHGRYILHLTALDYDYKNPALRAYINERVEQRYELTKKCVERGIRLGFLPHITWDDVTKLYGPNTWLCIDSVVNTYKKNRIPVPENIRQNCFVGPEVDAMAYPDVPAEKVIKLVREAGGVIALAHPHQTTHLVPELYEFGLNGIEVSHPDNYENTSYLALEMAKKYNLYHCGGTDHTGPMSGCGGEYAIPAFQGITEEEYYILKERRKG